MMKNGFRLIISIVFIAVFIISTSYVSAATKESPIVSLSATQTVFEPTESVKVNVTYTNPTSHSLRLLKWFTPADGLEESIFEIKVDGKSVPYTGAIYKRPGPTPNDYISIKSGESITYTVNLDDYYDLSKAGKYEIVYSASSFYLYSDNAGLAKKPDSLTSESILLKIAGRPAKVKPTPPPPTPGSTVFNSCTTTQQAILLNAREEATTYALDAWKYLLDIKSGTLRYTTWFGIFDTSRHITVTTHFDSIYDAWDTAGVTFDCKCRQPYYAYVYPDKPYNIYLCKVFWQAPLTGTDSQAGTLIHEMSHFYVVASTEDYVYGQTGAMNLALTNPENAIMNADNHEYFAENNPYNP